MPHCVIEHFGAFHSGSDQDRAMELALSVCSASKIMAPADIKVRSLPAAGILFGDGRTSFIHITLSMLAGRTEKQKITVSEMLREAFRSQFAAVESISVDIRDMDPACYRKSLL